MSIPVDLLHWLLAALPLAAVFLLLVKLHLLAYQAAAVSFLIACLISLLAFRADVPLLVMESGKGLWNAFTILLVVWPAVFLYEISEQAGAFSALKQGLQKLTEHELLQVMILGWLFPSFMQGITGFGVAVAVGAPLLMGIGVKPKWATVCVLLCHSWGGTFGTLAIAWQALSDSIGLAGSDTALASLWAAGLIWIINLVGGVCLCWFYGKKQALKEGWPLILLFSLIQGGGEVVMARLNPTLACFLPACLALAAAFILSRTERYSRKWALGASPMMERQTVARSTESNMNLKTALFPYLVLTGLTLVCLLIPQISQVLSRVKIGFAFPEMETGYGFVTGAEASYSPFVPFQYAGSFLLVSDITTAVFFCRKGCMRARELVPVLKRTAKKAVPSSLAVIFFILTSKAMGCSGQIIVLATGAARVLGRYYALLVPAIGLLGSFVTSSNMSSNIMFGVFQTTTAGMLGLDICAFAGAQTAGGAVGNAICPGNIVLGTTTTGKCVKEGEVLKTVVPIAIATALLIGLVLFILLTIPGE